jgi:hypothetical protein
MVYRLGLKGKALLNGFDLLESVSGGVVAVE